MVILYTISNILISKLSHFYYVVSSFTKKDKEYRLMVGLYG